MEGILVFIGTRNEINSRIVIQSNMLSQANRDGMIHIKMVLMLVEINVMLVEMMLMLVEIIVMLVDMMLMLIEMLGKRLRL